MTFSEQHLDAIRRFTDQGNTIIGRPAKIIGELKFHGSKSGSRIFFNEGCILRNAIFNFPQGGGEISVGENSQFRGSMIVSKGGRVDIGKRTHINRDCMFYAWEDACIEIGDNCLLSNIKIRTSDLHSIIELATKRRRNPARDVIIEDHVWLGEEALIYKGSRISSGSIVGAAAVVTGYVPPNCIVAGNPAQIIRTGVTWNRKLTPMPALSAASASQTRLLRLKKFYRSIFRVQT